MAAVRYFSVSFGFMAVTNNLLEPGILNFVQTDVLNIVARFMCQVLRSSRWCEAFKLHYTPSKYATESVL